MNAQELINELWDAVDNDDIYSRSYLVDEVEGFCAENARMRELVGDMWTYITEPVDKRNNLKERLARLDDIGDRMSRLGIEVE